MNPDIIEVEAIIVVPDVGEYRYVGRSGGGPASSKRISDALMRITLPADMRSRPYEYGVQMTATDPADAALRETTFGVVDGETFEGEIYEYAGCHQNDGVTFRMRDQTSRKMASICDVFSCYVGIYVREWHFNSIGNGVPDEAKPYLEN